MKIIPLIHLKKGKMIGPKHSDNFSLTDLLERYKDDDLYILDQDGIEKNKPNLCIYQKLSKMIKPSISEIKEESVMDLPEFFRLTSA